MTDSNKRGFAKNPELINKTGRPKGTKNKETLNKELKNNIKEVSGEALDNLIGVMRFNKDRVEDFLIEYIQTRLENQSNGDNLSEKELDELLKKETDILKNISRFNDQTARYSIKVLDYAYNLVLHDEKLSINKIKIKETEEDDEEDDDFPQVSTSA